LLLVLPGLAPSCGRRPVVQNKGSDTMSEVAQAWAAAYRKHSPGVAIAVSGGGSGVGISALINGDVDLANCSRRIKANELQAARKNGADPQEFVVGFDALAVYVHKDNPVPCLSLQQLAEIYGDAGKVTTWTQVGVQNLGDRDNGIVVTSRQNNSGTYEYFKEAVLGKKREFRLGTRAGCSSP
jgi:phosphate transport system substrate-binding protein